MELIPMASEFIKLDGKYQLTAKSGIFADDKMLKAKNLLVKIFSDYFGAFDSGEGEDDIRIIADSTLSKQEYKIDVDERGIVIRAQEVKGALLAAQTLRILLDLDTDKGKEAVFAPFVHIEDKPKFLWRGLSMDVVRHFFDKFEMLRLLDLMARMKLNVLHWHLTDDQGWRLPIDKYPLLNEISSYRDGTLNHDGHSHVDNKRYGGFYTKAEIKEIVDYADSLGIEVVPEIDLPGHTSAIVAAYPSLSCKGAKIDVRKVWGISKDVLCAGNDEVYAFVKDILDEVAEMFPSKFIHLGGDEAPKENWQGCPKCQAKIKDKGLKNAEELQGYFFNEMLEYLKSKGKRVIGWNECLNDNLDKEVIVQHWTPRFQRRNATTVKHINNGRQAIMSDFLYTYFDYPYAWIPLQKTYDFNPLLKGVKPFAEKNILGVECNMWTEYVPDREKLDFNMFPRLAAFAENAWTENRGSYGEFLPRLSEYYKVYEALGVGYAKNMERRAGLLKGFKYLKLQFDKDAFAELNIQKKKESEKR